MIKIVSRTNWIKIFESLQEANSMAPLHKGCRIQVGKKTLCIAHNSSGLFAVDDKCPHNGASLSGGFCTDDNYIVCPLHRYPFDMKTGRSKIGGYYLEHYPVEVREDGVYIGFIEKTWKLF